MQHSGIEIQVKDVRKKLGLNQALDGVSINFESGVMHGLIGPEGAGKTTLLRTIIHLLRPDQGEITYLNNGKAVPYSSVRHEIAYMTQQQSLYADLSIDEHLQFRFENFQGAAGFDGIILMMSL